MTALPFFLQTKDKILKNNTVIITGTRTSNRLWSIPHDAPPNHADGILRLDKDHAELVIYHHTTLGSPAPSTLLRTIRRGHLTTFPGLTTHFISKHRPKSIATTLGNQDQEAENTRSTRSVPLPDIDSTVDNDLVPSLEPHSHQILSCSWTITLS